MGLYNHVNCSTCRHNQGDLEKPPCKRCEVFSEWMPLPAPPGSAPSVQTVCTGNRCYVDSCNKCDRNMPVQTMDEVVEAFINAAEKYIGFGFRMPDSPCKCELDARHLQAFFAAKDALQRLGTTTPAPAATDDPLA